MSAFWTKHFLVAANDCKTLQRIQYRDMLFKCYCETFNQFKLVRASVLIDWGICTTDETLTTPWHETFERSGSFASQRFDDSRCANMHGQTSKVRQGLTSSSLKISQQVAVGSSLLLPRRCSTTVIWTVPCRAYQMWQHNSNKSPWYQSHSVMSDHDPNGSS